MSSICLTYTFQVIWSFCLVFTWYIQCILYPSHLVICWDIPDLFLGSSNAIGMLPRLHTYFGSQGPWCIMFKVLLQFNAKRDRHAGQRQCDNRCSLSPRAMWLSINCDCFNFAAAATPEKDHDDVYIELAQFTIRKVKPPR